MSGLGLGLTLIAALTAHPTPDGADVSGIVDGVSLSVEDNAFCEPLPEQRTWIRATDSDALPLWEVELEGRFDAALAAEGMVVARGPRLGLVGADGGVYWSDTPRTDVRGLVVGDGFVIVQVIGPAGAAIERFDLARGTAPRRAWSFASRLADFSPPVVAGDRVFFATPGHVLRVLAATTGALQWEHHIGERFALERVGREVVATTSFSRAVRRFDPAARAPTTHRVRLDVRVVFDDGLPFADQPVQVGDTELRTDRDGRVVAEVVGSGTLSVTSRCSGRTVGLDRDRRARVRLRVHCLPVED